MIRRGQRVDFNYVEQLTSPIKSLFRLQIFLGDRAVVAGPLRRVTETTYKFPSGRHVGGIEKNLHIYGLRSVSSYNPCQDTLLQLLQILDQGPQHVVESQEGWLLGSRNDQCQRGPSSFKGKVAGKVEDCDVYRSNRTILDIVHRKPRTQRSVHQNLKVIFRRGYVLTSRG